MLGEQSRTDALDTILPVASTADVQGMIDAARSLYVEESLNRYTVALLRATRADGRLVLGASPRSGISLLRAAKARALMAARDFVVPDDIKAVAVPVLSHRLILGPEARASGLGGAEIVAETVQRTAVPL
jgi:MoxR-like ATPase